MREDYKWLRLKAIELDTPMAVFFDEAKISRQKGYQVVNGFMSADKDFDGRLRDACERIEAQRRVQLCAA